MPRKQIIAMQERKFSVLEANVRRRKKKQDVVKAKYFTGPNMDISKNLKRKGLSLHT
jgi:hypothetical protein